MDEFGSSIEHKDEPNAQVAPFLYAPNNKLDAHTISYNVNLVTNLLSLLIFEHEVIMDY